jgi:23S rRNA (cytosine1962-C5)-methyltransferase
MSMRQGVYRLPDDVSRRVRLGHPWIFADALGARKVTEPTGSLVDLIGNNRGFLARGYVDREHPIAIRVITRDADENIHPGSGAITARFMRAVKLRWQVLGGGLTGGGRPGARPPRQLCASSRAKTRGYRG